MEELFDKLEMRQEQKIIYHGIISYVKANNLHEQVLSNKAVTIRNNLGANTKQFLKIPNLLSTRTPNASQNLISKR